LQLIDILMVYCLVINCIDIHGYLHEGIYKI